MVAEALGRNPACNGVMRLTSFITALMLILGGCSSPRVDAKALADSLAQALAEGPGAEVRLEDAVPSDWRVVTIVGPYTSPEALRRCLGNNGSRVRTYGIESRDDVVLLVFTFPDGEHQSVAVPRSAADFGPEAVDRRYDRAQARFAVRVPTEGSWGRLAPANGILGRCG